MDNKLSKMFDSTVRIYNMDPMDQDAVWPANIEICITRIPIRKRDGFDIEKFRTFAKKLKFHMVRNGIVFIICYAPVEAKWRPFELASTMNQEGFNHIDNIVVQKSWFPGKRSDINLVNSHEYVLHFCNGDVWKLDRLPIKEYMDLDGEEPTCPGNTWKVDTGSLDDSIPLDLAELLLRMTDALPGSIIFDPYMGNQSTLKSALKLGHSFYGFERDAKRVERYNKTLKKISKTGEFK